MFIDDLAIQDTAIPQPLHLAGQQVFTRRAERLLTLAQGHAMADFLQCCAAIAQAQQACHDSLAGQAVNNTASLRDILARLHQALGQALGDGSHSAILCLQAMDDDALQALALSLRAGTTAANPALQAGLPLLGAALQVQAVISARQLDLSRLQHTESDHCPVCHAPPVASLLRRGDSGHAVRYACCSQCASEWHVTRVKCLGCGNTRQLQYRSLAHRDAEPAAPNHKQPHQHRAVQEAECCDSCHGELKIVSTLLDPLAEPFADDLASLMLDMLAGEAGYGRIGVNPYFIAGEA